MNKFIKKDIEQVTKGPFSLWLFLIINPIRKKIALIILNHTSLKPVHLSLFNLFMSVTAFVLFLSGDLNEIILGGLILQLAFLSDSLDGIVAKLKKTGSVFGVFFDSFSDLVRIALSIIGFSIGLWKLTNNVEVFIWAILFVLIILIESQLFRIIISVKNYYGNKKYWTFNSFDKYIIFLKDKLEKYNLRLVLFGFNEREAFIFFIMPFFKEPFAGLKLGVIIAIPFLFLRISLDIAMLKYKIIYNENK